jgi:hypothetical protein
MPHTLPSIALMPLLPRQSHLTPPLVAQPQIFLEATLAAKNQKRVGSAYLNADIGDEIIHMKIQKDIASILVQLYPDYSSFVDEMGSITVRLKKSLYGCKQSGLNWYSHIKLLLHPSATFQTSTVLYDPCVFVQVMDDSSTILLSLKTSWSSQTEASLMLTIDHLRKVYKEVSFDIGCKHSYLGMTFTFNNEKVKIEMEGYITNLITEGNISGTSSTPAGSDLFIDEETPPLPAADQKEMHTTVAKLLFLSTRVRPDILLPVNYLTTRVNRFASNDKKKLLRVLKYLNKTKLLGLTLKASDLTTITINNHSDASYGVYPDGRSQSASATSLGMVQSLQREWSTLISRSSSWKTTSGMVSW